MAVPKRKTSKARRDKRRSHLNITATTLINCTNCGEKVPTHTACPHCGHYKGRLAVKGAEQTEA